MLCMTVYPKNKTEYFGLEASRYIRNVVNKPHSSGTFALLIRPSITYICQNLEKHKWDAKYTGKKMQGLLIVLLDWGSNK